MVYRLSILTKRRTTRLDRRSHISTCTILSYTKLFVEIFTNLRHRKGGVPWMGMTRSIYGCCVSVLDLRNSIFSIAVVSFWGCFSFLFFLSKTKQTGLFPHPCQQHLRTQKDTAAIENIEFQSPIRTHKTTSQNHQSIMISLSLSFSVSYDTKHTTRSPPPT
jgi:hypothetical protein